MAHLMESLGSRIVRSTQASRRIERRNLPWASLGVLAVLVACAVAAPLLAPHDPTTISVSDARTPPAQNWLYPLGTDVLGRDMLSRLIHGARTSMIVSLVALIAGAILGTVLGLISGNEGGRVDALIMRVTDATMAFPSILVAMVVVVLTGAGVLSVIVAVALTGWPRYSRMIRGEALSIKQLDFVVAARVVGCTPRRVIWRHVFPGVINTLLVIASLQVPQVILLEASLSFLGLGLPPGAPSWGVMVAEGRAVILEVWWLSLLPGLAITMVVLAFNFFGDWLRDTLDPRLRHV